MPKAANHRVTWSLAQGIYQVQHIRDQALLTIEPESSAWFAWLDQISSFAFWGRRGHFTARKESRRGAQAYWYAYVAVDKKLTKRYLGKTCDVTLARLEQVAAALSGQGLPEGEAPLMIPQPQAVPLRSLHDAQHHGHLHQRDVVGLPAEFLALTPGDTRPTHLPFQPTSLIGREKEVATVQHLLEREDVHLLTLTGPGGVGKTRLGLHVAARLADHFPDGVCFVNLAPLRDAALVLPTIAQTLGVTESVMGPILDVLRAFFQEKQMLLVLDNFEQVLEAAVEVATLLASCPRLKVLVTSRAVLHLRGEQEFVVPSLALPDPNHLPDLATLSQYEAIALFIARAQLARPDFQVTNANATSIVEICVRLDGLPLAIELAAARSKLLPPQALLARLSQRLALLTTGARDAPARQQTLRNTLAWSYDLLDAKAQRLFRRLAVFVGGCTLEAVEAVSTTVGETHADVLENMAYLLDNSLLQQTERDGEGPRFMMLETIREYGSELLDSDVEAQALHQAHAAYYLALTEQAEPELSGPQQIRWFERLEREHDNLRAALSWLLEQGSDGQSKELALRLSGALWRFWEIRGYVNEGLHWLKWALEESRDLRSAVRAKALLGAGELATRQDDFDQAEALCREGLALYRELGNRRGCATALSICGYATLSRSNYTAAKALLEEALALFREVGDTEGRAFAVNPLATVLFYQGEYARAQALLEESLILSREGSYVQEYTTSLVLLGLALLSQGDLAQASARLEASLAISSQVGYKRNIGISSHYLGLVALLQGDVGRARSLLEESLVLLKEVGERGRIAEVFFSLGLILFRQGDHAGARGLMEESLKTSLELNYRWDTAGYLEGLAAVEAVQGEPVPAVWFMSAAQALREAIETPLPSVFQALHEFTIASVRKQLGEQAFDAAWTQGRTMTPEHVLVSLEPKPKPALAPPASASDASLPPLHAELTPREMEVLRLLVQGMTSAQIAEQLVIGLVTVNSHVRSIYNKLGVTSRTAATRYALEHKLL